MSDERELTFEEARERLRERGYLDRGVEGAVLRGALAARSRAAALVRGAAVATVVLAGVLAAAATVLATARSSLGARDAAVLLAYVLVPALGAAAAAVGLLVVIAAVRLRGRGDPDLVSTELGTAFGLLAGVAAALAARPALQAAGAAGAAAVAAAVALAVFAAVRVARGVTLAVLLAQGRAAFSGRPRARAAALVLALLAVPVAILLARRSAAPPSEPLVVAANTRRVVLVGVDGWSERYLPAGTAIPGVAHPYRKDETDPAAFWTTVATGERSARHGVGSLELVSLAGMSRPLRPVPGTAWWVGNILGRVGLSWREPATSAARRVPAVWEIGARAGISSAVIGWWTTWPAEETGATVLSNHLFFAARDRASLEGEGWPLPTVRRAASLGRPARGAPGSLERLIADARELDAFSIGAFREVERLESPRLSVLYLPGLDILAAALSASSVSAADRVAVASALTAEAGTVASFLADGELRERADLLVLVLDGGRAEAGGSIRISGPLARSGAAGVDPLDVTPTILAVLGVPGSREIAGRVRPELVAPGAVVSATVSSWGRRAPRPDSGVDTRSYVENLRSLGYLR